MKIQESVRLEVESLYLLISNRKKCTNILLKGDDITKEDRMDFLISLHLVLELGLNALMRKVIKSGKRHYTNYESIDNHIDQVSYLDKLRIWLFSVSFKGVDADELGNNMDIIGNLINFSEARNKLLHGHMIGRIEYASGEQPSRTTRAHDLTTEEFMNCQIDLFIKIVKSMSFFIRGFEATLTDEGRESFIKEYLDTSFLST
ncbi:MAG: hypothetical protein PHH13_03960 [Candidatus Peribacteraceae bacterium]|nr:hypothetical protein [Candidatus Peribacteraceae bacterium]